MADKSKFRARRIALQAGVPKGVQAPSYAQGVHIINATAGDLQVSAPEDPTAATNYFVIASGFDYALVPISNLFEPSESTALYLLSALGGTVVLIWS